MSYIAHFLFDLCLFSNLRTIHRKGLQNCLEYKLERLGCWRRCMRSRWKWLWSSSSRLQILVGDQIQALTQLHPLHQLHSPVCTNNLFTTVSQHYSCLYNSFPTLLISIHCVPSLLLSEELCHVIASFCTPVSQHYSCL